MPGHIVSHPRRSNCLTCQSRPPQPAVGRIDDGVLSGQVKRTARTEKVFQGTGSFVEFPQREKNLWDAQQAFLPLRL